MRKQIALFAASAAGFVGSAHAALPADVTDALTEAATNAGLLWAGLLAIALVGVGFKLGVIGAKKAPSMVK
jgi:hypothetical protein